jgi:Rps23 Pro-64 3,4-dihydroxylase Tpa1-like proline 4-hydroxylase
MRNIFVDEEFFSQEEMVLLDEEFKKYNWELVGSSVPEIPEPTYHWDKTLPSEIIENLFKSKIQKFLNKQIETIKIYANGNTHGQCGHPHVDVLENAEGEYYTLVYYYHKNWKPEYGGHLILMEYGGKIIENIFPKSNSAVLFDSKMPHCPLEPTVHCKSMRISIAYKFRVLGDLL